MRILFVGVLLLLFSCGEKNTSENKPAEWNQDKSTQMNKDLAIEEQIQIKLFLERHKDWKMEKTGTGLQYYVYQKSEGDSAKIGQVAQVELKITLLDDKEVYQTAKDEVNEFVIDRTDIESGIHEGIKKMRVGEKAKLIIPSHLGHGLIGDLDKVPPLSVLVVDIHLIKLK
jgi:FKBP-type peptidyl-prolyl cis-trans isomerase